MRHVRVGAGATTALQPAEETTPASAAREATDGARPKVAPPAAGPGRCHRAGAGRRRGERVLVGVGHDGHEPSGRGQRVRRVQHLVLCGGVARLRDGQGVQGRVDVDRLARAAVRRVSALTRCTA